MIVTEEFKEMPTLLVASTLTGICLDPAGVNPASVTACASWLLGYPIGVHEFTHTDIMPSFLQQGYLQFPRMPDEAMATEDFKAATKLALDIYGPMLNVRKGNLERSIGPIETAVEQMPNSQIIGIVLNG